MKRSAALLVTLLVTSGLLASTSAPAAGASCATRWGSLPEVDLSAGSTGEVVDVRAGRHGCFDRLVLDVSGAAQGFAVQYVDEPRHDGSGLPVPVRGGASLEVVVTAPATPTDAWFRPDGDLVGTAGYRTFRQVAWAGSFEGQTTVALGVRARLPFRVLVLDGPGSGSRVVVDVAHRW